VIDFGVVAVEIRPFPFLRPMAYTAAHIGLLPYNVVVVNSGVADIDHLVPRGDTVNLPCPYSSSSHNIDWAKVIHSNISSDKGYDRIVEGCAVMPRYTSLYEVRATRNCDLVVVNASISHAGRYVCYANGIESEEVSLSVLGTCETENV